ncbi:hypothetical protein PR001_g27051, partial [Phytophthora rubi]
MSMHDYVQKTRHLVSCIVTNPIDVASQVHVFIFGMREGMTRYCLTRAEPSTLEAAFALALREDYTVASSYSRALTPDARASAPEPMEIDAIEAESRSRLTSTARGPRFSNDNRPRDGRQLVCYRCRKSGHRAAVCRAPAPVLASAEVVGEADDTFPTALPKNGRDRPPVLYAHFNATTTDGDSRLILISLHVAGAERPLHALLDSGATNNFIRDDCLALLPSHVRVWEGPGEIAVKLADGKPLRAPRRAVSLAYAFDGFSTNDDFLVIELNYAFDCILGMPWLARYQPEIDWLARSVRRRVGYDVSEVFTHLLVAPSRHVAVVDRTSTDHASLRTAMKSPHLSQRMARWLSFFAEYNSVVHYNLGKNNILADALSRRPDYDPRRLTRHQDIPDDDDVCATCVTLGINATVSSPVLPLRQQIADAYEDDAFYAAIVRYLRNPTADTLAKLTRPTRDAITRYDLDGDLLTYAIDTFDTPRVVIPADYDLRACLVHEYNDAPAGGHLGREKTFAALSRDFFWPRMYKWIRKWVHSREICQRVKPASSKQAPLRPLPIATSAWRSVNMDFIFGLPRDAEGRTGVLVFVDCFSKMVHLAPVAAEVTADESAELFLDLVFRHHGLPESIVSDRDPRFTSAFWTRLFALLGTRLLMSTAAHPETDVQTERVNRVLEDVLRSYATSFASWSSFLPMAEFALNNSTHASTDLMPFFVNNARHPRVPALLAV